MKPIVRCPTGLACTGCRYCEAMWEALEKTTTETDDRGVAPDGDVRLSDVQAGPRIRAAAAPPT